MTPILTIGITSYKRIDKLWRCILSVKTKYKDDIEILVSEDRSPQSAEIQAMVEGLAKKSKYNIIFTSNEKNLGYDMNLGSIIKKANGKYIFYMSDDDAICEGFLDLLIPFIKEEKQAGVLYAPFIYSESGKRDRYHLDNDFRIPKGEKSAATYIYDSILFSGLIYRKEYVTKYDSSRFRNYNYFQVYMFLQMLLHHGGFYFAKPSVMCIGDGENAYGIAESSGGNELLANRKSVISNLEFNRTLIKVVKMFDEDENCDVINSFSKQYSLHSYSGLSIARGEGIEYYKRYWKTLNSLDIRLSIITKCYYLILLLLGEKNSNKITNRFRKLFKKE